MSVTNSRGLRGSCGFLGLLRGFVSLKFKNPQTHIFKLRGFGFQINVSLWVCGYVGFNLMCGFVGFSFSCFKW